MRTIRECLPARPPARLPQCGIDIEPDSLKHGPNVLKGIRFQNVLVAGNKRCGLALAPGALMGSPAPIDIEINGMVIRDVPGTAYQWGRPPDHNVGGIGLHILNSLHLSGQVDIRNLTIERTYSQAVSIENWPSGFIALSFTALNITNCTNGLGETRWHGKQPLEPVFGVPTSPIVVMPGSCANSLDMRKSCNGTDPTLPSGGLTFVDSVVYDRVNRSWLSRMWTGTHGPSTREPLPRLGMCPACTLNATGQSLGRAIAAARELKSSLWATAGGNGASNPRKNDISQAIACHRR